MRRKDQFGRGGAFKCMICNRLTRYTGQDVDHLCEPCYEIAGMDNSINDGCGDEEAASYRAECERLLKVIVKKGGDGESVKQANSFVWKR